MGGVYENRPNLIKVYRPPSNDDDKNFVGASFVKSSNDDPALCKNHTNLSGKRMNLGQLGEEA
jgi:hypothetical protein